MNKDTSNTHPVQRITGQILNRVLIGERIQALRQKLGCTGQELARETGIPRGTIGAIETGRMLTDPARLLAFKMAFGVSIDFILTGEPLPSETTGGDSAANGQRDE